MGFSIYDILKEADDNTEDNTQNASQDNTENTSEPSNDNNSNDDNNNAGDDDFSIDASLDNGDDSGDNNDNDDIDMNDGNEESVDTDSSGDEDEDDEVNEDNTDIFSTLTAEEQKIKIKELKLQFQELYNSCDEILNKLTYIEIANENDEEIINKISNSVDDLRNYIYNYICYKFADNSFIENDIMFNRFLSIIHSIYVILDKYSNKRENSDNNIQK